MTLRSVSTLLAVFALSCAALSAQGLVREWTIDYPYPEMPKISSGGELFARPLTTTTVARYDGSTGALRDTVTTPFVGAPERVAFCGTTLYVLSGTRRDSLPMYRCSASHDTCERVPYTFRYFRASNGYDSIFVKSVGLYAVPGYPRVLVEAKIEDGGNHTSFDRGQCEEVDTTLFTTTGVVYAKLINVSWSAETDAFVRVYYDSYFDPSTSPDDWGKTTECIETYRGHTVSSKHYSEHLGGGSRPPNGFRNAIHSGSLNRIIYDTVEYDMVLWEGSKLPARSGKLVASLYAPTTLLQVTKIAGGEVMSAFNYVNGSVRDLDTVPSCTSVWINGRTAVMYMLDTVSKTLTRYGIAPFNGQDSISIIVEQVKQKILRPVKVTARLYTVNNAAHQFVWTLGDSTVRTSSRTTTMLSTQVGQCSTSVMAIDTLTHDTVKASGEDVTLYRPEKNIMVSNDTIIKGVIVACSPAGDSILISTPTSLFAYHVPQAYADQAFSPTSMSESYAFAGYYTSDSMRYVTSEPRGGKTFFRFYNTDVGMTGLTLVDTLTVDNAPPSDNEPYVRFYNLALYNREQRQHISLFRVRNFNYNGGWAYDGIWLHRSDRLISGRWYLKGTASKQVREPDPEILHADASYGSTLMITEKNWIQSVDLTSALPLFMIDRVFVGAPKGAIQIDSTTIVTTNGILKRGSMWTRERRFSFDDGIKLLRMDARHTLVLRSNADNVASVVDHETGNTVEEIGEGFGAPIDGVFDPVRKLLHVIDSYNYTSSYAVGTPVSVDEETNPVTDDRGLTIQLRSDGRCHVAHPTGINSISVYDLSGRCVFATTVDNSATSVDLPMPHQLLSGIYVVAAYGQERVLTGKMVYVR